MKDLDCPVLVAAGQSAFQHPKPITIPAYLAEDKVPDLIVVSGCHNDGTRDESTP